MTKYKDIPRVFHQFLYGSLIGLLVTTITLVPVIVDKNSHRFWSDDVDDVEGFNRPLRGTWWDTDWDYYKTLEISGKIEGYSMKIIVDFDDDYGGNISCDGHCQSDFDDLRFVYNNETVLPYWVENTTESRQTTVWVNNTGNYSSFEMFYGNDVVGNVSNGFNTFIFFDDFERGNDGDPLGNGWVEDDQSIEISTAQHWNGTRSGEWIDDGVAGNARAIRNLVGDDGYAFYYRFNKDDGAKFYLVHGDGTSRIFFIVDLDEDIEYSDGSYIDTLSDTGVNVWERFEITDIDWDAATYDLWFEGVKIVDDAGMHVSATYVDELLLQNTAKDTSLYIDGFIIRMWTADNPYWSSFGDEKQKPGVTNSNPSPSDDSEDIGINTQLSIMVNSSDSSTMNVGWYSNSSGSWMLFNTNNSVNNGTYKYINTNFSNYYTTYYWSINTTDGNGNWDNDTYSFTTETPYFNFSINQDNHTYYGLQYPITYNFTIPDMNGLKCYRLDDNVSGSWEQITSQTSKDAHSTVDMLNGVEMVRFDNDNNTAYVSIGFSSSSNYTIIKFTDSSNNLLSNCSYNSICEYYDNREAVVTLTWDDWQDYQDHNFTNICNITMARNLVGTPGVITRNYYTYNTSLNQETWDHMQEYLDVGCIEIASHTRRHPHLTNSDETFNLTWEINGSKQDILENLTLPYGQFVYALLYPFGDRDATTHVECGEHRYLIDRDIYTDAGASYDFSTWDSANYMYNVARPDTRMGSDGVTDCDTLNSSFDSAYNSGGIYHLMSHPKNVDWDSYGYNHFDYICNHTDVWYVGYGLMYLYHYAEDQDIINLDYIKSCERPFASETTWQIIDQTINGSYSSVTSWKSFDNTINGSYSNTTIFRVLSQTVNGSYSNMTQWKNIDTSINGSYNSITSFIIISQTINGSYYNDTILWSTIDTTINGSYGNTTQYYVLDQTINGSYSNSTMFNIFDQSINGSYSNTTIYRNIDTTINGSYNNETITFQNIDITINGSYSNTSIPSILTILNPTPSNHSADIILNTATCVDINYTSFPVDKKIYEYYYDHAWNSASSFGKNVWFCQNFTIGTVGDNENFYPTSVKIALAKKEIHEQGNITVGIREVATGMDICNGSTNGTSLPDIGLGSTYEWRNVTMTPSVLLSANTQYFIVIRAPDANSTSALYLWGAHDATYPGGCQSSSSNSGASWYDQDDYDKYFYVWGENATGSNISYSFWTNESGTWASYGNDNISSNQTVCATNSFSSYDTTYYWSINATNGTTWTNRTYTFTTTDGRWQTVDTTINGSYFNDTIIWNVIDTSINGSYSNTSTWLNINTTINGSYTATGLPPALSNPNPANGSTINTNYCNWSLQINDSSSFNWSFECSNGENSSGNNDDNDTYWLNTSGLITYTTYTIWVNATDGNNTINASYIFTVMPASSGDSSTPGGWGGGTLSDDDDVVVSSDIPESSGADWIQIIGYLLIGVFSFIILIFWRRRRKKREKE